MGLLIQGGNTIEFMLSPYRDRIAAKHFLQLAYGVSGLFDRV